MKRCLSRKPDRQVLKAESKKCLVNSGKKLRFEMVGRGFGGGSSSP